MLTTSNHHRFDISVVIPARNEEKYLPACIQSIKRAALASKLSVEIIVVLNRCNDRTEEIAKSEGCVLCRNDSKNLSQIRNTGAGIISADILVTIDADSRMSKNMLSTIASKLSEEKVVGGGVLIIPERMSFGIFFTSLALVPLILLDRISAGLFYCKKTDFDAIGGFDERYISIEDIDFARRLRGHGKKTGRKFKMIWSAFIITSCRKFDHFGDWYLIRNPTLFRNILSGKNEKAANVYWYDVER